MSNEITNNNKTKECELPVDLEYLCWILPDGVYRVNHGLIVKILNGKCEIDLSHKENGKIREVIEIG